MRLTRKRSRKLKWLYVYPPIRRLTLSATRLHRADKGLDKYFGENDSVIINCDNNSPDNTKQVFLDTPTKAPKIYLSTDPGVKGKGNNFRNLFKKSG